jgi:hypothetical protein
MAEGTPRQFYLFTYPRTASNLLAKILALDDQPTLLTDAKREYFFVPIMKWMLGPSKLGGKHLDEWTQEEKEGLMDSYQACFDSLQEQVHLSVLHEKNFFVKEHIPWLVEPVTETKWLFGAESTMETPWTVSLKNAFSQSHSPTNETVFPDEFLKAWLPTFLIRHPALVFPSNYRTGIDLQGAEAAKSDPYLSIEMTMRWSRALFEWYTTHYESLPKTDLDFSWPIILDADDIMLEPDVVRRYSEILGLDQSKLRFSWEPARTEDLEGMSRAEKRMRSTIVASDGIVEGKTSVGLDIAEEAKKWRAEFGEEEGKRLEVWVRAAMPDYEYMRARRLRSRG